MNVSISIQVGQIEFYTILAMSIYQEIQNYLESLDNNPIPTNSPRSHNRYPSEAPVILHHYPVQQAPVIVNNYPPNYGYRSDNHKDDKEKKDSVTSGQVLGAATILTATAIGLSYLTQSNEALDKAQQLQFKCKKQLKKLSKLEVPDNTTSLKREILNETIDLLEMEINRQSNDKLCKITGLSSIGVAATGSVLQTGFLVSLFGLSTLALGCMSLVFFASTRFSDGRHYKLRSTMVECIQRDLVMLEKMETEKSRVYPSAPPAETYNPPLMPIMTHNKIT